MDPKKKRIRSPPSEDRSSCRTKLTDTNTSKEFSFSKYRNHLNSAIVKSSKLKLDESDFWLFLRKYEEVKKIRGYDLSEIERNKLTMIDLGFTMRYVKKRLPANLEELKDDRLNEFMYCIATYIDFKQKEDFEKIYKLRQNQKALPIATFEKEIVYSIKHERVAIIAGDTGCGKSTQVPRYLLKNGFTSIACTQPRRIACVSLAQRLSVETLSQFSNKIGYQIRFEKQKDPSTLCTFLTEGLLLRQLAADPMLSGYQLIILDEVHERHLFSDYLLGVLKCLLLKNENLNLVLMSATINIKLFTEYFGGYAKVITVPGRLHPVTLHYRPYVMDKVQQKKLSVDPTPYLQVLQMIDQQYSSSSKGDVLIFMSGVAEISKIVEAVKEYNLTAKNWIVLSLHSNLALTDQQKVFDLAPDGMRKCIVATNIAETSITIDGIRFVIDSGKVKEMCYDSTQKLQRLKEYWISAASAEQRKGRAGRTGPGVCYRIYSEEEYHAFEPYSSPEIKRVSLDSLLLQMISMGLPDCRKFPFIEPPDLTSIENSLLSLRQHSAINRKEEITALGRMLASLPVDTSLGKMLIMGALLNRVGTIIPLVASLSVQSPLTSQAFRDIDASLLRKEFESSQGDPVTLLKLFYQWLNLKRNREDSRRWCRKRGIEEHRFYEIIKLCTQFKKLLEDASLLTSQQPAMTKAERSMRHGELKILKSMKTKHQVEERSRGRKILKPESWCFSENEPEETDIKDIEFRIANDQTKIKDLLGDINITSRKSVRFLKLIFCFGMHPQLAIKDELNDIKKDSEQLFHTKNKNFVFLHPNCYFANNSDILRIEDSEITVPKNNVLYGYSAQFASTHQVLCYSTMLETNKPYLTNCVRMPALTTVLFFANHIDTNFDLSRIICDDWIMFDILNCLQAETLVLKLIKLRKLWNKIQIQKIEEVDSSKDIIKPDDVEEDLDNFLASEIIYSMKRLLPADLKTLYAGSGNYEQLSLNPLDEEFVMEMNLEHGGIRLSEFFTYNSVVSPDNLDSYQTNEFKCSQCLLDFNMNTLERLIHKKECVMEKKTDTLDLPKTKTGYYCGICNETLDLSSTQILKHQKAHSTEETN